MIMSFIDVCKLSGGATKIISMIRHPINPWYTMGSLKWTYATDLATSWLCHSIWLFVKTGVVSSPSTNTQSDWRWSRDNDKVIAWGIMSFGFEFLLIEGYMNNVVLILRARTRWILGFTTKVGQYQWEMGGNFYYHPKYGAFLCLFPPCVYNHHPTMKA